MFSKKELLSKKDTPNTELCDEPLFRDSSTLIHTSSEPAAYYYHSTGSMNPMKLIGILGNGILSKDAASEKGLTIDSTGLACNGSKYISVSTKLGGCVNKDKGALHFAIDKSSVTAIRHNPEQYMPLERQIPWAIPRRAIKAVYMEKAAVLDLNNSQTTLGIIWCDANRARTQVRSYLIFMKKEFRHDLPIRDQNYIEEALDKMADAEKLELCHLISERLCCIYVAGIEGILKKHLKLCYQTVISTESITPYDILRYYDQDILVYDLEGNVILSNQRRNDEHMVQAHRRFIMAPSLNYFSNNITLLRHSFNTNLKREQIGEDVQMLQKNEVLVSGAKARDSFFSGQNLHHSSSYSEESKENLGCCCIS